jgi:hypothetical protein
MEPTELVRAFCTGPCGLLWVCQGNEADNFVCMNCEDI